MWIVVDTETTGLNCKEHSIISIGMILVDNELNVIGEPIEELMLPEGKIDPKALAVNQIDVREIKQTREEVVEKLHAWLDKHNLLGVRVGKIGHNLPFDDGFMEQLPVDWDTLFDRHVLDTKVIATFLQVLGAGAITSTSLGHLVSLVPDENLKLLKPHGALNDCYRTLGVLRFFVSAFKK